MNRNVNESIKEGRGKKGPATPLNVLEDDDQQDQDGKDLNSPVRKNGIHD